MTSGAFTASLSRSQYFVCQTVCFQHLYYSDSVRICRIYNSELQWLDRGSQCERLQACGQEVFLQKELHCAKPWEKVLLNIWVLSYNCLPVWTSVLELNALKMI